MPLAQRSGATPWLHPAVDPETNTVFWVFGNNRSGSSQNGSTRPGINLFASSVVALDLKTGAYKWHFQMVHHDHWDMENMSIVLADVPISGQMRKLVFVTGKTGQAYILDRLDGSAPLGIDEVPVPTDTRQAVVADPAAPAPGRLDRELPGDRAARRPGARQPEPRGAELPHRLPLGAALGRRAGAELPRPRRRCRH